jgi:hypothetical protein
MKLSESKVIKWLNKLSTLALALYAIVLLISIFNAGVPNATRGIKWYSIYDVKAEKKDHNKIRTTDNGLGNWFNQKVFVSEVKTASISLRFKSYAELFSFSSIAFQLAYLIYFICIGFLVLSVKLFFRSLLRDEVFTRKNSSIIIYSSIVLIFLPVLRWIRQELSINCINNLHINDSGYYLFNGASFFGAETLIGLVLLAFGLAFKVGVDIKQENEAFV